MRLRLVDNPDHTLHYTASFGGRTLTACIVLLSLLLGCASSAFASAPNADSERFRVCTFSADITIPLGHRCMGVLPQKSKRIVDRLYAHGMVLLSSAKPIVLCAVDWCELRNGAYDQWREELAIVAGTTRERVLLSALHQHDAPVVDTGAAKLLRDVGLANELYDETFHSETIQRVSSSLKQSLAKAKRVTHIGFGKSKVQGIASNRRVVHPDGRVTFERGSRSGADSFLREFPEGEIDPYLRTVSFWDGDTPIVELHSYATHPMSHYGRGEVSSDFVGLARERLQRDDFSVRQIYFSGCSGDVTAGKYNDGSVGNRFELVEKLYQAMVRAKRNTQKVRFHRVSLKSVPLSLGFHARPELTKKHLLNVLNNKQNSVEQRILAAMGLSSRERVDRGQPIDFVAVDFGYVKIVLFPAESFVGYQLMAQQLAPNANVFSIGYGESWPGYIPTERAFREGFEDKWLWVGPGCEPKVREALSKVFGVDSKSDR